MQFTSALRNLLLALVLGGTTFASFAQVAVDAGVSISVGHMDPSLLGLWRRWVLLGPRILG
jgi:hypothetical protein